MRLRSFLNFKDNTNLDRMGFAAFGEVVEGMEEVVDRIYSAYGEKPDQGHIQNEVCDMYVVLNESSFQQHFSCAGKPLLGKEFPEAIFH